MRNFVRVDGLGDFIRGLNLAPAQMRRVDPLFRRIAAETVARMAEAKGSMLGGVAPKASADVRITGVGRVTYGGHGYDMGAEFGSYQYRQFSTWRGNQEDAGYFFWPSIREFRDKEMSEVWIDTVWHAVRPLITD